MVEMAVERSYDVIVNNSYKRWWNFSFLLRDEPSFFCLVRVEAPTAASHLAGERKIPPFFLFLPWLPLCMSWSWRDPKKQKQHFQSFRGVPKATEIWFTALWRRPICFRKLPVKTKFEFIQRRLQNHRGQIVIQIFRKFWLPLPSTALIRGI